MNPFTYKRVSKICASIAVLATVISPAFANTSQFGAWVDTVGAEKRVATTVVKDDTIIMRTAAAFKEVRVANADIADVVVLTNKSFHIMGKKSGKTNVMLYDSDKRLLDIVDVTVGFDLPGLKRSLYETFPNEKIQVRAMAGGIYLFGDVTRNSTAQQALKIAQAYAPDKVTNGLSVRDSHQVQLEVRFVEASRDVVKELGIGMLTQRAGEFAFQSGVGIVSGNAPAAAGLLQGGFDGATLDTTIEALEEKGSIRTLAEPNLVSMSGDTASFLAGGEFPVPVQADQGQIAIQFRQFGVGLSFTPTVLDDGIINLKVVPEVSQLDATNGIRVAGVEVPSLRVRRANTTVELRNSQSFAIAGLLQNNMSDTKVQTPWLGDVPVLGALFRSSRYQRAETELVIIVTPRLVQPVSDIRELATPLDTVVTPSEADFFLNGKMESSTSNLRPSAALGKAPKTSAEGGLSAQYGHALQ